MSGSGFVLNPNSQEAELMRCAEAVLMRLAPLLGLDAARPASVVDFGCNVGVWLAAGARLGMFGADILGIDQRPPAEQFRTARQLYPGAFLRADIAKPLGLNREFHLAVCVEVAEHLDGGDASAEHLINNLAAAAPLVLFSAAIPGQGGNHHVNEQWPEYWARKWRARGFRVADVRALVWNDERVLWWYRQNLLIAYHPERVHLGGEMLDALGTWVDEPPVLSLVHPGCYGRGGSGLV
jgi:SAM-dependent methyltransferase